MKNWFMKQPDKNQQKLKIGMWIACGVCFLWLRVLPNGSRDLMGYLFLLTFVLGCVFTNWHKESSAIRQKDRAKAQDVHEHDSPLFSQDGAKPHTEGYCASEAQEEDIKSTASTEDAGFSKGTDDSANE